jgi:hypothetical protein
MLGFYPHQHVLKRRRSLRDGWIIIEITAVEDRNGFAILLLLLLRLLCGRSFIIIRRRVTAVRGDLRSFDWPSG